MPDSASVLLVGFDAAEQLAGRMRRLGFEPVVASTLPEALAAVESIEPPLSVGVLPPHPSLQDLPQALQLLRERSLHSAFRWLVVGDPPEAGQVARLRDAGVSLACWEPWSEGELRFLLNHLLHGPWNRETRADPRVPTTLEASVHAGASPAPALVYSLSEGGAFLETEHPSAVGEEVFVELPLPAVARTVQARVVSHRARQGLLPPGMGVRFLEMDDATLEALAEYVEARSRRFQLRDDPAALPTEVARSKGAAHASPPPTSERVDTASAEAHPNPSREGSMSAEPAAVRMPLVQRWQAERRTAERVWMRSPVSFEVELQERPALLVDLSWRGCRILATEGLEPDAPITISLPKELMNDDSSLPLPGWVLRCAPDSGDASWPVSIAVVFDELTQEGAARLSAALGLKFEDRELASTPAATSGSEPATLAAGGAVARPATFGRYLLERGLLSRSQLEDATQSMVVYGGRLGTHLVEADVFDAEVVEAHLAAHLGVRAAPVERVESPQREALAAIPRTLIRRRKVFPFDCGPGTLHVAMRDPRDDGLCQELERAAGLRIEPYLVSEVRLFAQLEHHFGLDRNLRYARSRLSPVPGRPREIELPLILLEDLATPEAAAEELPFGSLADGEELIDPDAFAQVYQAGPSSAQALPPSPGEEPASTGPADESPQASGGEDPGAVARLEGVLDQAGDREQVLRCALEIARTHARSAALFLVREIIEGVAAAGEVDRADLRGVLVPLQGDSMLATAARTGELTRGVPASGGVDDQLLRFVRRGEVRDVAFVPVAIRGRVVNVLCVDNGPDGLAESSLAALSALAERICRSYERIIVERKSRI